MLGKGKQLKNYRSVSLPSVVSKAFEKVVNNKIVDHPYKSVLFSDFKYCFRSSQSTADLFTVASNRIAETFNRTWATRVAELDIYKALDRV